MTFERPESFNISFSDEEIKNIEDCITILHNIHNSMNEMGVEILQDEYSGINWYINEIAEMKGRLENFLEYLPTIAY